MSKKIVYYDTNIWAAYMLGPNDRFYSVCEPLIDNVINGQNLAIVTYLVIMETIYVLRKSVVKDRSDGVNTTTLTNNAKKLVDKFIHIINTLSEQKKIVIPKSNKSISSHHHDVVNKMKDYLGCVWHRRKCTNCEKMSDVTDPSSKCLWCGGSLKSSKCYLYKGLGHADIEHVYFASYFHASIFYTTDRSFNNISKDSDFKSITFNVKSPV